ncbi:16S rRNA (cytidine(1402)-2'-O)-methyltransferase [bacterium]|nr:16S rRNA (cytidine(1402)-2'-O)-methyltransferase [bacterium]
MSLFIVSLPIGNPEDITLRAISVIKEADFIICEEFKNGRIILKSLNIEKDLYCLNEHNEQSESDPIIQKLLHGQKAALFSDCGTPLFADPGTHLVNRCVELGIRVVPVPGASSILAALVVAGIPIKQFYFAGFLSRKSDERKKEISTLAQFTCPIIIYDTPYRLKALLSDLQTELSPTRQIIIAFSLTQPQEKVVRGSIAEISKELGNKPPKQEFVLILCPLQSKKKSKKYVNKQGRGRRSKG